MKKPLKKQYCKNFALDSEFITFDSKGYSKAAEAYIDYLIMKLQHLANAKTTPLKISKEIYSIIAQ